MLCVYRCVYLFFGQQDSVPIHKKTYFELIIRSAISKSVPWAKLEYCVRHSTIFIHAVNGLYYLYVTFTCNMC